MTTSDSSHTLSLNTVDEVLPPEFAILKSDDPRHAAPRALRAVRDTSAARTHSFYSPLDYLKFVTSVSARQVLGEAYGTRYVLLSSAFDSDPYDHASITQTIAACTPHDVVMHRLKSAETAVRLGLSADEMTSLITSYQSYLEDCEQADAQARSTPEFDPFVEVRDDEPGVRRVGHICGSCTVPNVPKGKRPCGASKPTINPPGRISGAKPLPWRSRLTTAWAMS